LPYHETRRAVHGPLFWHRRTGASSTSQTRSGSLLVGGSTVLDDLTLTLLVCGICCPRLPPTIRGLPIGLSYEAGSGEATDTPDAEGEVMCYDDALCYHQTQYRPVLLRKGTIMKTLSCSLLLVAMFAFVLLGCSDNSTPVEGSMSVTDNPPAPLMKTSGSGASIVKYDTYWRYQFLDETGLLVTVGIDNLYNFCTGATPYLEEISVKQIFLPTGDPDLIRVMQWLIGTDVTAMAFQVVPGSSTTLKGYICGKEPIAVGTVRVVRKDNDALGSTQGDPNAKSFGYKVNGTLEGPEGQKFQLNLVWHIVAHGGDDPDSKEYLKIQLPPCGK
jgi:hypothetical protein